VGALGGGGRRAIKLLHGLGLVKRALCSLGGRVKSRGGKLWGARFLFTFFLVPQAKGQKTPKQKKLGGSQNGKKTKKKTPPRPKKNRAGRGVGGRKKIPAPTKHKGGGQGVFVFLGGTGPLVPSKGFRGGGRAPRGPPPPNFFSFGRRRGGGRRGGVFPKPPPGGGGPKGRGQKAGGKVEFPGGFSRGKRERKSEKKKKKKRRGGLAILTKPIFLHRGDDGGTWGATGKKKVWDLFFSGEICTRFRFRGLLPTGGGEHWIIFFPKGGETVGIFFF